MRNRVQQYLAAIEDSEYPTLGPYVAPFTALETLQMDAFRAIARLHHWFIIEDRSVPGLVCLSARPLWVRQRATSNG